MRLGYNTNGLAHHTLREALSLLADLGYQSVAVTIDHPINPASEHRFIAVEVLELNLKQHRLSSVIETGARYLLNPRVKHEPTLMTSNAGERQRRIEFYKFAIDCARKLGSDCVSLWSGVLREPVEEGEAWDRLIVGLREVGEYAQRHGVVIGFEPEPGMFIDTMAKYQQLIERVDEPWLKLTLDIGHLHCQGETPIADQIHRWGSRLVNVHLEDMRAGVHEHLQFGEGEIDFAPVMVALKEVGYRGGVHVELSRHSHVGPEAAREARILAALVRVNAEGRCSDLPPETAARI